MRIATLKSYTKQSLTAYYKKPLRLTTLLTDATHDERVAEAAQAYYLARHEQAKANLFATYTHQLILVEDFATSNQKYARQFRTAARQIQDAKADLKVRILEIKVARNWTWSALASAMATTPSNAHRFFCKDDWHAISLKKLSDFYRAQRQHDLNN